MQSKKNRKFKDNIQFSKGNKKKDSGNDREKATSVFLTGHTGFSGGCLAKTWLR